MGRCDARVEYLLVGDPGDRGLLQTVVPAPTNIMHLQNRVGNVELYANVPLSDLDLVIADGDWTVGKQHLCSQAVGQRRSG